MLRMDLLGLAFRAIEFIPYPLLRQGFKQLLCIDLHPVFEFILYPLHRQGFKPAAYSASPRLVD